MTKIILEHRMKKSRQKLSNKEIIIIAIVSICLDALVLVFGAFDLTCIKYLFLIPILIFITAFDFKFRIIPNVLILAGLVLWILCISADFASYYVSSERVCLIQTVKGAYMQGPQEIALGGLLSSICFTAFCAVVAWFTSKISKHSAFGMGDIKMVFMLCLFFDLRCGAIMLIIACIAGLVFVLITKIVCISQYNKSIPFGLTLAVATIILIVA